MPRGLLSATGHSHSQATQPFPRVTCLRWSLLLISHFFPLFASPPYLQCVTQDVGLAHFQKCTKLLFRNSLKGQFPGLQSHARDLFT